MIGRVAHLEKTIASQSAQIKAQTEKINEIWKLLQGNSHKTAGNAINFSDDVRSLLTVSDPESYGASIVTPSVIEAKGHEDESKDSNSNTVNNKRTLKRKDVSSSSPNTVVIKNKRRKAVKATKNYIKNRLPLHENMKRRKKELKESKSKTATQSLKPSAIDPAGFKKMSIAEKFQSIIPNLSPSSREVGIRISQCHTYNALGKMLSAEGSTKSDLAKRFSVCCAFAEKMTKENKTWYLNFLSSSGAVEMFVGWLQDLSSHFKESLDKKLDILPGAINEKIDETRILEEFKMDKTLSCFIELLLFIIEETPNWTKTRVLATRIDKTLKELYKTLSKSSSTIIDRQQRYQENHKELADIVEKFGLSILKTANTLRAPWEAFRKILQAVDEDE